MKNEQTQKQYWNERAKDYNDLEWVHEDQYIKSILKLCNLKKKDIVLDVGTGTGIMMSVISPFVKEVHGLDISEEMLSKCNVPKNGSVTLCDIRRMYWPDNKFDLIVARMVFHHVTENISSAFQECYRVLKPGGRMVISEGIPPDEKSIDFFIKVFSIKEKRQIFHKRNLWDHLVKTGFGKVKLSEYVMKRNSILKWLARSNLEVRDQIKILYMYFNAPEEVKKAYNIKITDGGILIDAKYLNVVCYKT